MWGGEGGVGGDSAAKAPFEATAPCVDALACASEAEQQALGQEGAQGPGQRASSGTAVASASLAQAARKTGREGNKGSQRQGKACAKKRRRKQCLSRRRYRAAKPEWVKRAEKARLEGGAQLRAIRAVFRDGRTAEADIAQTTWSGKMVVLERTALALTTGRLAFQGREQMPGWDRGFRRHGKGWRLSPGKSQRKGVERCIFHDLNCIRAVVDWRAMRKGRVRLLSGDISEAAWEPGPSQLHYTRLMYHSPYRVEWKHFRELLASPPDPPGGASEIEAEFHRAMNALRRAGLVDQIKAAQASEELRISMAIRKQVHEQRDGGSTSTVPERRTGGAEEALRGGEGGEGGEGGQGSGGAGGSKEGSDSDSSSDGSEKPKEGREGWGEEVCITILGEEFLVGANELARLHTNDEEQELFRRRREWLSFDVQAEIRRVIGGAEVFLHPEADEWGTPARKAVKEWVRRDGHAEALAEIVARVADDLGIKHWERWFEGLPYKLAQKVFGEDYLLWAHHFQKGCGVGDWSFLSESSNGEFSAKEEISGEDVGPHNYTWGPQNL